MRNVRALDGVIPLRFERDEGAVFGDDVDNSRVPIESRLPSPESRLRCS
jgi:hypothetical protein